MILRENNCIINLKKALEYKLSLTYPADIVNKELRIISEKNRLEAEEVSEYTFDSEEEIL